MLTKTFCPYSIPFTCSASPTKPLFNSTKIPDLILFRIIPSTISPSCNFLTLSSKEPNVSLYVSGQNLITITGYSHYDPEASWTGSAVNGWDRGVYPSAKSYTLGLNVKF